MHVEQLVQQAIEAAGKDDRLTAHQLLAEAIRLDPACSRAWYVLAQVVTDPQQAIYCLNKVLELQPGNRLALEMLQKLGAVKVVLPSERVERAPRVQPARRKWGWLYLLAVIPLLVGFFYTASWWGWGSCGKVTAGQAMNQLEPLIEDYLAVLQQSKGLPRGKLAGPMRQMRTLREQMLAVPIPKCMTTARHSAAYAVQIQEEALQLYASDPSPYYDGVISANMDTSFRQLNDALQKLRNLQACAPFCMEYLLYGR